MLISVAEALPHAGDVVRVAGHGGVDLAVRVAGPVDAPPVVLLHGFSQGALVWLAQFASPLRDRYRLIAPDLRGHGASAPGPVADYADGAVWAADLHAVLQTLAPHAPALLVGWSYGGRIIGEYLRRYGPDRLRGLLFIGATSGGGSDKHRLLLGPGSAHLMRMLDDDPAVAIPATQAFLADCPAAPLPPDWQALFLAINAQVQPTTRRAMLGWVCDNDDILAGVTLPTRVIHGSQDRIVRPESGERIAELIPRARLELLDGVGHCPFVEAAAVVNGVV